jgi:hypothetical protein
MKSKHAKRHSGEYEQFCGFRLKLRWRDRNPTVRERCLLDDDPPWKPEDSFTIPAIERRFAQINEQFYAGWGI